MAAVLSMNKSIPPGIHTHMGNTAFVSVLEKDQITGSQIIEPYRLAHFVQPARGVRQLLQIQIIVHPAYQPRTIKTMLRIPTETIARSFIANRLTGNLITTT